HAPPTQYGVDPLHTWPQLPQLLGSLIVLPHPEEEADELADEADEAEVAELALEALLAEALDALLDDEAEDALRLPPAPPEPIPQSFRGKLIRHPAKQRAPATAARRAFFVTMRPPAAPPRYPSSGRRRRRSRSSPSSPPPSPPPARSRRPRAPRPP